MSVPIKTVKENELKHRVKSEVYFSFYSEGKLWYRCFDGWEFPVPIEDTGTAQFLDKDKGIFFMRWIRKYMDEEKKMFEDAHKELGLQD